MGIATAVNVVLDVLLSEEGGDSGAQIDPETLKSVLGMALQTLNRQGKQQEPMYQAIIDNLMYLDRHGELEVAKPAPPPQPMTGRNLFHDQPRADYARGKYFPPQ